MVLYQCGSSDISHSKLASEKVTAKTRTKPAERRTRRRWWAKSGARSWASEARRRRRAKSVQRTTKRTIRAAKGPGARYRLLAATSGSRARRPRQGEAAGRRRDPGRDHGLDIG